MGQHRMGLVEWGLLGTLSLLWGGSFFFNTVAVRDLEPLTVVMGRVVLGAVALNLIVLATGGRMPTDGRRWRAYLGMGVLNNVIPFGLIVWGQTQIASGLASILNATTPVFAVLLAHVLTRDERLTPTRSAGVVLGFSGATVMIGPEALGGLGLDVLAQLAVVGAAISYACAGIYGRRLRGNPPLVNAAGQVTCSALCMLVVAPIADRPWERGAPSVEAALAVIGLALLSTAVGYTIYFRLLASAGATNLMLVTLLVPVSALILAALFLDESLTWLNVAGMGLIALGLAAIDGRVLGVGRLRAAPDRAGHRTREP